MADKDSDDGDGSNLWILIPLAALSIPIIAVAGESSVISWAIAIVALVVAVAAAAGALMTHRHKLRMSEIAAQADIARLDTAQLEQANRILEQNAELTELRSALRASEARETQTGQAEPNK